MREAVQSHISTKTKKFAASFGVGKVEEPVRQAVWHRLYLCEGLERGLDSGGWELTSHDADLDKG
jgi:hypothetical protein